MRANEICSLYLDNVKELRGNQRDKRWCFDIIQEEDRPDKRLKNLSSRRIVPIHQTLLELGFVDFLNLIKKNHSQLMARKENDSLRNYLTRNVCTQEKSADFGTLPI